MALDITELAVKETFWKAVNEYVEACGGDTSTTTISERRMRAVATIESVLESKVCSSRWS